jgi:hypothetical protein
MTGPRICGPDSYEWIARTSSRIDGGSASSVTSGGSAHYLADRFMALFALHGI